MCAGGLSGVCLQGMCSINSSIHISLRLSPLALPASFVWLAQWQFEDCFSPKKVQDGPKATVRMQAGHLIVDPLMEELPWLALQPFQAIWLPNSPLGSYVWQLQKAPYVNGYQTHPPSEGAWGSVLVGCRPGRRVHDAIRLEPMDKKCWRDFSGTDKIPPGFSRAEK